MLLFYAQELAQSFGDRDIFKGVGLEMEAGEKLGLVGANGIGKTSLLRIIAGADRPVGGKLTFFQPVKVALLTEAVPFAPEMTVNEVLQNTLESNQAQAQLGEVLKKFRFHQTADRPVSLLSGGEKTRLQLACIWLQRPELLLLDEPTNHLDSLQLDWLERFVREYPGTVLLVSHDRYFLDRTVRRIVELQRTGAISYPGNYSDYAEAKRLRYEQDLKLYFDRQREAQKLRQAIAELQGWGEKAHRESRKKAREEGPRMGGKEYYRAKAKKTERRVKSQINRLQRMLDAQEDQPRPEEQVRLQFRGNRSGANCLLMGEGIGKAYDSRILFHQAKFAMKPGEKVGLIGPNGSGKTTLLKIIAGLIEADMGSLWRSPAARLGYLDQETSSLIGDTPLWEEVAAVATEPKQVRNLLAGLLFTGDDVLKPCSVLSMGERVRVELAKLLAGENNLLLLDEPTNYLDLPSRERLEEALLNFSGAVILVSHDRYLLDRVCGTIWNLSQSNLNVFPGGYSDYLKRPSIQDKLGDRRMQRLQLEYQKAKLLGDLSMIDRGVFPEEYARMEREFLEVVQRLKDE